MNKIDVIHQPFLPVTGETARGDAPRASRRAAVFLLGVLASLWLAGCSSHQPPASPEDLCAIFKEKPGWYKAAKSMRDTWGTPIQVPMAMMYQESAYRHDAKPAMRYFLFIPIGRPSSAYGYAQVKDETWKDYQRERGSWWSDRDDFADAMDFMGWYTAKTQRVNGVSKWDAYGQYLNYHEGWGGYRRGTYKSKAWLMRTAQVVSARSNRYASQLQRCDL